MAQTIHIIGDSHSSIFTGLHGVCGTYNQFHAQALPSFQVWHLGQYLAHSVGSTSHEVHTHIRRCLKRIPGTDRVVFFFGEIDCRNHVVRHTQNDHEVAPVAAVVAEKYVKRACKLAGARRVAFVAVPPATVSQHGNQLLPTVGTFDQRRVAVNAFNAALRATAAMLGAHVIDVHDALATPHGHPSPAYFADGVHADPRALPVFVEAMQRIRWLKRSDPACAVAKALSMVPPSADATTMLPGRLDDPRNARRTLIERAALICKASGARRIAIWGAGKHTEAMGIHAFEDIGIKVAAIIDDNARPGRRTLHGVPVLPPDSLPRSIHAVVASSDAHEQTILERARATFQGTGTLVVPIYTWQELDLPRALATKRTTRR